MIDLVCLVADKNMEAAIAGLLGRPAALDIREIQWEVLVHPNRDPGCFHQGAELLSGYRDAARHALVVLDRAWEGAPASSGDEIERLLEASLLEAGFGDWVRPVAIDPELEVWIFSDSPHVAAALGWTEGTEAMRRTLAAEGLWEEERRKPHDPKAAVEWALRRVRKPRSSALFRRLARVVSLHRCEDRAFLRLKGILQDWFPIFSGKGA